MLVLFITYNLAIIRLYLSDGFFMNLFFGWAALRKWKILSMSNPPLKNRVMDWYLCALG